MGNDHGLDNFISRFFQAFDNRNGRIPNREELEALFVENAVILHSAAGKTVVMTVSEFADPRVALLTSGRLRDFSEWETAHSTEIFANFAIRTSQYSKSGMLDSMPYDGRAFPVRQPAHFAEVGAGRAHATSGISFNPLCEVQCRRSGLD